MQRVVDPEQDTQVDACSGKEARKSRGCLSQGNKNLKYSGSMKIISFRMRRGVSVVATACPLAMQHMGLGLLMHPLFRPPSLFAFGSLSRILNTKPVCLFLTILVQGAQVGARFRECLAGCFPSSGPSCGSGCSSVWQQWCWRWLECHNRRLWQ